MTKNLSLEELAVRTFRRYNRITFKERISHIGRWAWQNKPIVIMSAIGAFLLYKTGQGIFHFRDSDLFEYIKVAEKSLDSLAESLGKTMVQTPSEEATIAVKNHYLEFLTNTEFTAGQCPHPGLTEIVNSLNQNAELFSGTVPGKEGLIKVNELRLIFNEVSEKYELDIMFPLYLMGSLAWNLVCVSTFAKINKPDEDYIEIVDMVKALNERIKYRLPDVFKQLKDLPEKNLFYSIAIRYAQETKDVGTALNFLFMAKETPEIVISDFEDKFKTTKINYKGGNNHLESSTMKELLKFVEDHIEKFESDRFDYGLMNFDFIGGYDEIKEELRLQASIFSDMRDASLHGVEGVTGIILEGPPGCGKTLLAEALINEALKPFGHKKRAHYKVVSAADLKSMWYSKSEQNVQRLYTEARRKAPYIIFIDEGEELFGKRDRSHELATSVTNQLLTEIGGVKRTDRVMTIITTNRMEAVDEAARRYGRLGVHYKIDVPNKEGIKEIARIHLGRLGRSDIVEDFNYETFAEAVKGSTGADIAGIISRTFLKRYRTIKGKEKEPYKLRTEHFLDTVQSYSKTVTKLGFK